MPFESLTLFPEIESGRIEVRESTTSDRVFPGQRHKPLRASLSSFKRTGAIL